MESLIKIYILLFNRRYSLQPGCWTILCAHSRSFEYYAETVLPGNEKTLMAVRCNSFSDLQKGKCRSKPIPMGFDCPRTARGDYYLQTNKYPPFGNLKGLDSINLFDRVAIGV